MLFLLRWSLGWWSEGLQFHSNSGALVERGQDSVPTWGARPSLKMNHVKWISGSVRAMVIHPRRWMGPGGWASLTCIHNFIFSLFLPHLQFSLICMITSWTMWLSKKCHRYQRLVSIRMMIIDVEGKHDAYKVTSVPVTKTGDMLEGNDGVCLLCSCTWYRLALQLSTFHLTNQDKQPHVLHHSCILSKWMSKPHLNGRNGKSKLVPRGAAMDKVLSAGADAPLCAMFRLAGKRARWHWTNNRQVMHEGKLHSSWDTSEHRHPQNRKRQFLYIFL